MSQTADASSRRQGSGQRSTISRGPLLPLGIALAALLVSLFFHSPRLWVFAHPMPGSTYWDRGLQFVKQAEHPLGAELSDAGLIWRLAPAALAHGLGLRGYAALVVPWLGLVAFLALGARIVLRLTGDQGLAAVFVMLLGTTSATLTVTGWLGMNDAWYVCALLVVAFQPQWWWLAGALLAGPWVDERFLFGLPGALFIRAQMLPANKPSRALAGAAAAVGLYLGLRLSNALGLPQANLDGYLRYAAHNSYRWMPWATIGWFMGQRAVWIFTLYPAVEGFQRSRLRGAGLAALVIAPLGGISLLAADTGRAPTLLLPLAFYGLHRASLVWELDRLKQFATGLLAINLMLPAMHVTYHNLDVINMLPVEIARWLIRS